VVERAPDDGAAAFELGHLRAFVCAHGMLIILKVMRKARNLTRGIPAGISRDRVPLSFLVGD
jgi:hypothetical protein